MKKNNLGRKFFTRRGACGGESRASLLRFRASVVPLGVFVIVALFLWIGLHRNPREIPSPLLGKPVPAFRAPSLQDSQHMVTAQNLTGRVTILNVFATDCIACQAEHSVWQEARQDLRQAQIVGLNYKDVREKTLAWLQRYGNPYDQIIDDSQGELGINLGVYGTPETFIIDQHGIIRYKFIGAVSPADWRQTLLPKVRQWGG